MVCASTDRPEGRDAKDIANAIADGRRPAGMTADEESLGRMIEVLRDAKDISALKRDKKGTKEKAPNQSDDDRDR
jgi:hypothetical protein